MSYMATSQEAQLPKSFPALNMDKSMPSASVTAIESQSSMSPDEKPSRYSPWPFMLLMLLMVICMGASVSILVISDEQLVNSWTVEPAVLFAIISSIWNYTAGSLLVIAVTITWWRNFLRGSTVRNLHHIWERGSRLSWVASFRAGVDARNVLLLALLVVLVQAINNPLLQRATHVEARNVTVTDTMMLNMVSQLPDGQLAHRVNATHRKTVGSRKGLAVAQGWWWKSAMLTRNSTGFRCDGICKGSVRGTGLKVKCNSTTTGMDFLAPASIGLPIFAMDTAVDTDTSSGPILILTTSHASALDNSCSATITHDTCIMEAGIVEYPIVIQENSIALDQEMLSNMTIISDYISPGDLPTAKDGQGAGPLQSINNNFPYLSSNATLDVNPATNSCMYSGFINVADFFFKTEDSNYNESIVHKCGISFSSPTGYAINFMHEFLFRAALQASTDADTQTFGVQRSSLQLIFRSNYHYLAAVLAAMLMALSGLLYHVWAWWELGWTVTMSPIETANAFRAPSLRHAKGRAIRDILTSAGDTKVRYGEESHERRAMIAETGNFEGVKFYRKPVGTVEG